MYNQLHGSQYIPYILQVKRLQQRLQEAYGLHSIIIIYMWLYG